MIRIDLTKQQSELRSLKITGHANSAPYGEDLVCAGVSAIVLASLNAIDELYPDACFLEAAHNVIRIEVRKNSEALQNVLAFLEGQLGCMAAQYPKSIRMEIRSKL